MEASDGGSPAKINGSELSNERFSPTPSQKDRIKDAGGDSDELPMIKRSEAFKRLIVNIPFMAIMFSITGLFFVISGI